MGTLLEEFLCVIQKTTSQTKWQLISNKKTLDFQNKGNFAEDDKTSKRILGPFCSTDFTAGTTFCVCGATQTNLPTKQEEQGSTFTPRRLCLRAISHEARDTTSRLERQHLRIEQSTASVLQGQGPRPKGRYNRCKKGSANEK